MEPAPRAAPTSGAGALTDSASDSASDADADADGAQPRRPGSGGEGPVLSRRALLGGGVAAAAAAGLGVSLGRRPGRAPGVGVFGAAGSFAGLARVARLPGGEGVTTAAVPGWGFGPGQAAFGCAVAADGTVVIGTTPMTDDPLRPTGLDMELGVLTPGTPAFTRVVVPSTTGRTRLPGAGGPGGGDVSAVVVLPGSRPPRVLFVSTAPYHGWDSAVDGELPSVGQLVRSGPAWRYDGSRSRTAGALAAAAPSPVADAAFPTRTAGPRDNRGTTDAVVLPRSGHVLVAQYFGRDPSGSGGLLALDATGGQVLGGWEHPPVQVLGQTVICHPRQLAADPSSRLGDERFVVVYDTFQPSGATVPFPLQEFSYDARSGAITPVSTAVRAAQDGSRMELAGFLSDGTLVAARTRPDGLSAAATAVYRPGTLARHPPSPGADATWGSTCAPDVLVTDSDRGGLVRSLTVDPDSGRVVLVGLNGLLQTLAPPGAGHGRWRVERRVDLGLDLLRSGQRYPVGVRQGALDRRRRLLWLPCNQLTLSLRPWPATPVALDQWLFAIRV